MGNDNLELANMNVIQKGVQDLLNCVRTEVNHMSSCSPSIYMVPGGIRYPRASLFNPLVVSIGPLHREDQNVQAFEKRKAIFLISLLNRITHRPADEIPESWHEILKICMLKAHASMKKIRASYVWTKTYDDAEVAKMMVMDACFILEFIHWIQCSNRSYPGINLRPEPVMFDLVLLENQIPFFFLDEIYTCTIMKTQSNLPLIQFIHPLLNGLKIFKEEPITVQSNTSYTTYHILSLLHQCYKPPENIKPSFSPATIHSAIDLDMVGVNFKPYKDPEWVMGIKVKQYRLPYSSVSWGKPTLEMPALYIEDNTELVLRNLIAYEQSCKTSNHITSYVWAMDMLVNTKEEVAKLVESGVIHNETGSNEVAANIFNNIGNGIVFLGFFYGEQWKTLHEYCNGYWPKHIAWLKRTYFSSPWSIIALLAGIILFALTVVQTIFSIKST